MCSSDLLHRSLGMRQRFIQVLVTTRGEPCEVVAVERAVGVALHDGVDRTDDLLVEGRAVDVDATGHLVVLDDCAITHRFAAGDVVHLR